MVSDDLWETIHPLLPRNPVRRTVARPVCDRTALPGILYVLRHGLRGRGLPQVLGYGRGSTCWRRLRA